MGMSGRKHTEETRAKMSDSAKLAFVEGRRIKRSSDGDRLAAWRTSDRCREILREQGKKYGAANGRAQALPRDIAAARIRFRQYRLRSTKKQILWSLTFETFARLIVMDCWYCGASPSQLLGRFTDQPHNGVDRVDNTRGYVDDNVVSCCGPCNSAKSDMGQVEFLALAKKIAERH